MQQLLEHQQLYDSQGRHALVNDQRIRYEYFLEPSVQLVPELDAKQPMEPQIMV